MHRNQEQKFILVRKNDDEDITWFACKQEKSKVRIWADHLSKYVLVFDDGVSASMVALLNQPCQVMPYQKPRR
jgi:hypothetical protein